MGTSVFPVLASAIVVCCVCFRLAVGERILLVPVNINSHVGYFGRLSEQLAQLGHDTHLLVTSNVHVEPGLLKLASSATDVSSNDDVATNLSQSTSNVSSAKPASRFTIERYAVDGNVSFSNTPEMSRSLVEIALAESIFERFRVAGPFFEKLGSSIIADCTRLMDNVELLSRLRAKRFQMVIMDLAFMPCYVLPYALEIPYHATLSASIHGLAYRVPRLPSFVSDVGHSDRMSFTERLSSFAQTIMLTYVLAPPMPDMSKRYAPSRPPISVYQLIFDRSSLWLYLEHPAVSFPRPLMPNTVPVGELMTGKPLKPLPVEVENFLSSADATHSQVVIISFGSFLDNIPDVVQRKLCDAVANLTASDADSKAIWIIWKLKNVETACRGSTLLNERHLLAIPWLPQYDLLADRRVGVFVTHGGFNSIVEAVYHSKPMVVIPVSLDQPSNAAVVESKGLGIRLELVDPALANSLPAAVRRVLGDADFAKRAGHASSVLRDLYGSETAAERASRAIEHVIKYGDQHLKTGAYDLSLWQFLMFDVCVFLLTASILLLATGALWMVVILRCCRRKCCPAQEKEKRH